MFRVFVIAVIGFVVAAVATYAAVLFSWLAVWHVFGVVDRDGGAGMAISFVIAPNFALIGGVAGAAAAGLYALRQRGSVPVSRDERRRDVHRFTLMAGVLAGCCAGYFVAKFAFWLAAPIQFDAMWKVYAHAWGQTVITLAGGIAGGLLTRRAMHA